MDPRLTPSRQTRIAAGLKFTHDGFMVSRLRPNHLITFLVWACVAATMLPLRTQAAPRGEFSTQERDLIEKRWPEAGQLASGLRYVILEEGHGPKARTRQRLTVLYKGELLDGTVFSKKLDPADPFEFTLGNGEVILGWEEAFLDMRQGEKRVLIIPFALGYGLRGREPDIPNRATLVFEVTLLAID